MPFVICPSGARNREDTFARCSDPLELSDNPADSDYLHYCFTPFSKSSSNLVTCDANQLATLSEIKTLGSGYVLQLPADAVDTAGGQRIRTTSDVQSYEAVLLVEPSTGVTESPFQMVLGASSAFLIFGAFAAAVLRNI